MIVVFFQYLQLARSLRFYGYLQFKPCVTNYPEEDTRVIISVGDRELNFRLQTPDVSKLLIIAFCVEICPEMQVNEMHALYDNDLKVSSFLKSRQNTHNSVKYEVI